MNITKKRIVASVLIILCGASPFLASASTGSQPPDLFAIVSNAFQELLASINNIFTSGTATTTSTPSQLVGSSVTFELGDKSVMVGVIQKALIAAGYLKETATGIFDANTQAAVEAFQKAKGFPVTGNIEIAMISLASSFSTAAPSFIPIQAGATGSQVSAIQQFLINNGYLKIVAPTAYFGTITISAVEAFQKSHSLPQTGVVDRATFAAMNGK